MGKTFRQELYQLRCRWRSWILLAIALAGCFVIARRDPVGVESHWKLDSPSLELVTKGRIGAFVYSYRHNPRDRHYDPALTELLGWFGLEPDETADEESIFILTTEAQYTRLMWFGGGLMLLCIILPAVLVRYPLDTGVPDWSARYCGSRRRVARAKVFVFLLVVLAFSLIYTLLLTAFFARHIVSRQGLGFFLGTLAVHTLMELAMLSIPMYIAFLCRNPFGVLGFNTAYGVLCYGVNVAAHYQDGVVFIPFPAWLHGLRSLWQPGASMLWLVAAALVSLAWILIFGWLSVRWFEKTGGKQPYDLIK